MTSPGPFRTQFDASIVAASLKLTKENVLFFRDSIYREADRLDRALRDHRHDAVRLPLLGDDPVSHDASRAFPGKIQKMLDQCQQYNNDLRGAAGALDQTARSYGLTEEDIANQFHAASANTVPQLSDTDRGRAGPRCRCPHRRRLTVRRRRLSHPAPDTSPGR